MNTQKIVTGLTITMTFLAAILLPLTVSLAVFLGTSFIIIIYYCLLNYDIDYHYWLSFASQLLALIFMVISVILLLSIGFNWLNF